MNKIFKALLAVWVMFGIRITVVAQTAEVNTLGKGISFAPEDNSYSLKLGMRFQSLYVGDYNLDTDEYTDQMLIRRARLKLSGHIYSEMFKYKVQLGLSNRDTRNSSKSGIVQNSATANMILDAVLMINPVKDFEIWIGQTTLPGNRERAISSQKLQFVDRSILNSNFNLDRDIGVQIRNKSKLGSKAILKEAFALSIGEGKDITTKNPGGYSYTGRVEFLPFGEFSSKGDYTGPDLDREKDLKMSLGYTYEYNDGAVRSRGHTGSFIYNNAGDLILNDLQTHLADVFMKYDGATLHLEYAERNKENEQVGGFGSGTAYMGALGYVFKNDFGIAARTASISVNDRFSAFNEYSEYTLGLSKYIAGHNLKFQANAGLLDYVESDNYFKVQFHVEVAF